MTPGYPPRLLALGWTPELEVEGCVPPSGPAVAIVGARAASGVGMARAHAVARHCAARGVHVVSGGALGIDGAAHRGALAADPTRAPTTVVLGGGVDIAYPPRHAELFATIAARGGTLLSMFPRGAEPRRWTFIARNQLIAALADVVLVIEASARSGSLATAAHARAQHRTLVAWPGSPGCDALLARGHAAIATSLADVDAALAGSPRVATRTPAPADVDPIVTRVADAIARGVTAVDAIAADLHLPVRAVVRALPFVRKS